VLQLHPNVMVALLAHIAATTPPEEGVLVLLPDRGDIARLEQAIQEHPPLVELGATRTLHLHEDLSLEEQLRVARAPSHRTAPLKLMFDAACGPVE
jgi:HrpA-like RNA helicase